MHRNRHWSRQPALIAIAASSLIALGLGACGSSSNSTTTATQANAATTSASASAKTSSGARHASGPTTKTPLQRPSKLRECLRHNGVKLPSGSGARGLFLNSGQSRAASGQLRVAMRKCLGAAGPGPAGRPGRFLRNSSPSFKQAFIDFAACMRKNGVNVPTPNTSGNGPVFSTKGLNTASAKFKTAATKCRPALIAGVRRPGAAR